MQTIPKRKITTSGTAKLGDIAYAVQSVPTDQISGDPEEAMGLSTALDLEGRPVEVKLFGGEIGVSLPGAAAWSAGTLKIYRNGVLWKSRIAYAEKANVVGSLSLTVNFEFLDIDGTTGPTTYEAKVAYFGGTTSSQFYTQDYIMTAKEL